MEAFLATACAMDWVVETDRARSFQPALDARIAAYPQYERELRMFDELWIDTLGGPIHENVELLERLRLQGERLYSITNFCDEKFEIARGRRPFLDSFDGIIVSGPEGLVKPDARIFDLFLTRFGFSGRSLVHRRFRTQRRGGSRGGHAGDSFRRRRRPDGGTARAGTAEVEAPYATPNILSSLRPVRGCVRTGRGTA
ncbi:MAG: hypothetical protein WAV18_13265 [Roseiarcus sp.]